MGLLKSIFTWWDGATIGTSLWSRRNGAKVGEDALGNVYFETKAGKSGPRRRWVIYNGSNDASRVPAEWHSWLHGITEQSPEQAPPRILPWQKPSVQNQTGTADAFLPAGALERGGRRAAATGDYEAWSPN